MQNNRYSLHLPVRVELVRGYLDNGGDESIAASRNGRDQAGIRSVVAERCTEHRNALRQAVLGNAGLGPNQVQQFIFTDCAVAVLDQNRESIEDFRRESNRMIPTP